MSVRELTHFIGGEHVAGTSGRFGDVFEPSTGEVQARVPLATKAEVEAAITNAEEAQKEWGSWNPQKRVRVLMRFVQLVQDNMDELAALLSSEHGKTIPDARGDVQRGLEVIEVCSVQHTCSRVNSPTPPAPASTSTRCANPSVSSQASPRSTFPR